MAFFVPPGNYFRSGTLAAAFLYFYGTYFNRKVEI